MADGILYRSVIIYTTLKKQSNKNSDPLILDLPFKYYGYNIVKSGEDITFNLHNHDYENQEVVAKIDYKVEDEKEILKFSGTIGVDWNDVMQNTKFLEHFNVKKEDFMADIDINNNKTKYNGQDKNDLIPFTKWYGANFNKNLFRKLDGNVISILKEKK